MAPRAELPQGTLDLLILKVVALGPLHVYAIAQRLRQISRDVVSVGQGSVYPLISAWRERATSFEHLARFEQRFGVFDPENRAPRQARTQIAALVMGQGARVAGAGIVLGTFVAWISSWVIDTLFSQVEATHPWVYAAVAAVLSASAPACAAPSAAGNTNNNYPPK